jgi:hypothetical protein
MLLKTPAIVLLAIVGSVLLLIGVILIISLIIKGKTEAQTPEHKEE